MAGNARGGRACLQTADGDPSAVVDRIVSFDTNRDDRITRGELPERMEDLVSRGDKNQDGFLTSDEIVALVDTQPTRVGLPPFTMHGPRSLADVIADLKLPPVTHDQAMDIVNGHTVSSTINDPDNTKLYVPIGNCSTMKTMPTSSRRPPVFETYHALLSAGQLAASSGFPRHRRARCTGARVVRRVRRVRTVQNGRTSNVPRTDSVVV